MASAPNIFEIATSVTVAGSRCASAQARAISLRTSSSGVSETLVAALVMHASYARARSAAIPIHLASWKMMPSVWRWPERSRLTPWRMLTR